MRQASPDRNDYDSHGPKQHDCFERLAWTIEDKRMRDFGSFFKGFDFNKNEKIDKKQAVLIL